MMTFIITGNPLLSLAKRAPSLHLRRCLKGDQTPVGDEVQYLTGSEVQAARRLQIPKSFCAGPKAQPLQFRAAWKHSGLTQGPRLRVEAPAGAGETLRNRSSRGNERAEQRAE
eukprot:1142537-Pelagomonas_calceolata.AAC.2